MFFLGWILVVLGILFIGLALAGAAGTVWAKLIRDLHPTPDGMHDLSVLGDLGDVIKALTDLVKALATSPAWLACFVVGAFLTGGGVYVIKYLA